METGREYLITGGAGFIGCNYADWLLAQGHRVTVYDNLSREGTLENLAWLQRGRGRNLRVVVGDVRDYSKLLEVVCAADVIVHLAAQTAVTTSVEDPWNDFAVNASGTLNVLEAARHFGRDPIILYASTNKVYGAMAGITALDETRYRYRSMYRMPGIPESYQSVYNMPGVPEAWPLDFYSPYGCSKGAADQYVLDYARIYGMRTVVFRQSCIYGPHQMGVEDQGWVAWLTRAAMTRQPIVIYGDGKQVRDVLYIYDLLAAYDAAVERIDVAAGEVYNIGGGPVHTVSVWAEFGEMLEELIGREIPVTYADWRPGDQRVYISDIRKAARELGWRPQIDFEKGLCWLYDWLVKAPAYMGRTE